MSNLQGMGEYNVDIVMCIDATGSMKPFIDQVKESALTFHNKFLAEMDENDKSVAQLRIKVIAFRDYAYDAVPMTESRFFTLPDENADFEAFVRGIEAIGGGDGPENALEAISLALKSDWTADQGVKKRHVVLVFTDAPALELGARASAASYPSDLPKDLAELGAWWAGTDQSLGSTFEPKAGRLVAFVPNAYPWTDLSSWSQYWPEFSLNLGLKDKDMKAVLNLLVGSVD